MTVRELGALLRGGSISCVDLIKYVFDDVKRNDRLHCFITLTEESAMREADERDAELRAGKNRGPWHGIPIAHKDLFYTRGVRTTAGSLVYRDFIPDYDATVVAAFRDAGAISIGKTNLHELAYGITSKNPHYGWVLNPQDPARLAGGSSGGSAAAIAAGWLPMALGTDTGGSIRIPASFCGVTGLKPTYGAVSRHGVLPLAYSLDHVGPLGSCVEDCALAMNVMAKRDPRDPTSRAAPHANFSLRVRQNLNGVRIGVAENFFFERVDGEVRALVMRAIEEAHHMGASVIETKIPDLSEANVAARIVQLAEVAAVYAKQRDSSLFGADVWSLIEQGRQIAGHEYVNGQRIRTVFRREFDALWKRIDILASPTTPTAAPLLEQDTVLIDSEAENTRMASTRLVRAINFLGEPALSMPVGRTKAGLPVGLQLIAAPSAEPKLLQVGRTLEAALS